MEQHLISALQGVNGTILHLGAGLCRELDAYLETAAEQIVLVEPDPEAAQGLRERTATEARVTVIEAAVAGEGGEATLHRYSVSGLSTLHPLKTLPTQWPGLREIAQLQVKALDMAQLLEQVTLEEDKQHWLVIETPGEEKQVLLTIGKHCTPQHFAYLSLTIGGLTPLMEQTRPLILQRLEESGYRLEHISTQGGQLVYHAKVDAQWKMIQKLNATLEMADEENKELKDQAKNHRKSLVSERKQLESIIKKEALNTTKQIEDFFRIQAYFNSWERLPSMHGWPVSPDFALYLIELLERNDYDLVIEFGSGSSTLLMAKVISHLKRKKRNDFATMQVAFEHLEQYYEETLCFLQQSDLDADVNLKLSPLNSYIAPNGIAYSYYSCSSELEALAKRFTVKDLKILLVVDGPPAATGNHARYPALPKVMEWFGQSKVDVLLDDYIREDEKEIVEMWLEDVKFLGLKVTMSHLKMEKDACFLSIKP